MQHVDNDATAKEGSPGSRESEIDSGKEALLEAYQKMIEARNHFKHAAESAGLDLKNESIEKLLAGKEKVENLNDKVVDLMNRKPLATMGVAFVVGWLFSRSFSGK
jgi:lipid A disaccharide synthetase